MGSPWSWVAAVAVVVGACHLTTATAHAQPAVSCQSAAEVLVLFSEEFLTPGAADLFENVRKS